MDLPVLELNNMKEEQVILVDQNDNPLGQMEKIEAHQKGLLHRAFSVFVLNSDNELMLQQRAAHKYHSPLLWTNTCCSHPRVGETNLEAAHRRLQEEMGFDTELKEVFSFIYKANFDNGLTEHEYDYVFVGHYQYPPTINPEEVHRWKWMHIDAVVEDLKKNPDKYTAWFKIIFDRFYSYIKNI